MMYEDYFKNIVGGSSDSPEYYTNVDYNSYPTYRNEYEMYPNYENDMYSMDNEYDRFMPRQVNASPYDIGYQDDRNYIEVSNLYPEIYRKVSPVLERVLAKNNIANINKDTLDKLTFEIYDEIETPSMSKTSPSISTSSMQSNAKTASLTGNNAKTVPSAINNTRAMPSVGNNTKTISSSSSSAKANANEKIDTKEVVTTPRRNNTLLSDLIRILILNRIFGNQRPPFPGGRPPMRTKTTFSGK